MLRAQYFRNGVAVLSIALAGSVLGVTVGLWERSTLLIDALRDVVGRHTWLVAQSPVAGVQPPPLPTDEASYRALREHPGVTRLALSTGTARLLGTFNYPITGVSEAFFEIRRLPLSAGRYPEAPDEAVVGYRQRALLGEAIPSAGMTQSDTVQVVGVLASVSERGEIDHFVDEAVFVPLENYLGVSGVDSLYVEAEAASFGEVGRALEGWMTELNITGFELLPLAERYGIALREQVAQLLSGALGFGVVAALLTAAANLIAFYLSRALARIRQLGVRRAVGASARAVVIEELLAALPWALLGVLLSVPIIYLADRWLVARLELSALPGLVTWLVLIGAIVLLVLISALLPAWWGAKQRPALALRGQVSRTLQRRLTLAGAGLTLGVAALVLQASSARSAVLETERLLGVVSERSAVLGSLIGGSASGFGDPRATAPLTRRDVQAFREDTLAQRFSHIAYTERYLFVELQGSAGSATVSVRAYEPDFPEIIGLRLLEGRLPAAAGEVLLGDALVPEIFEGSALGETLRVLGRAHQVVGIFRTGEAGIPGGVSNMDALVPLDGLRAQGGVSVGSLALKVAPGYSVRETLEAAAALLTDRFDPEQFLPFSVLRPADEASRLVPVRAVLQRLSTAYTLLAWILLLLGGAGLAAQMLVALSLRVREIGIRRAIGADTWEIFGQFVGEALTLAAAATVAGLVLGVGLSALLATVQGVVMAIDRQWLVVACVVAPMVALLFAIVPSLAAAQLAPARAMREEG
jgi:putative ABC transport system permease protein